MRLEGPKNLHGTKWMMFHDLLDIIVGLSKRGELDGKLGSVASNQIAIGGTCMGEIPLQELGMLFCN